VPVEAQEGPANIGGIETGVARDFRRCAFMRIILVIGIGTGNPDHLTVQAVDALNRADRLFIPEKGVEKAGLVQLREMIIERHRTGPDAHVVRYDVPPRDAGNPSYAIGVEAWHAALADIHARLIAEMGETEIGAFLVWGDPSLYDSTLRILERVKETGLDFTIEVIPGITSVQALTAAHAMTLNRIGEPVTITTGRRIADADPSTDLVVMLDGQLAFRRLEMERYDIFWGAYLGSPDEILIAGPLAEVADRIESVRAEARAHHGWIMDTYLLRRREQ
jgi:precorrin-6A synthase